MGSASVELYNYVSFLSSVFLVRIVIEIFGVVGFEEEITLLSEIASFFAGSLLSTE
jgi:hypothetical protein